LNVSYKNQRKLSETHIGVFENLHEEYEGILGLTMALICIRDVKENDYVINKASYEKISKGPNNEGLEDFFYSYTMLISFAKSQKPEEGHIPTKLSERKNQEKPILSYDALIGQIQNGESLPSVFKELENSANSLSSKECDDVYYKMLMRSMNKAIELNEVLKDTHFHKELKSIYDEISQTYNINSTSSKEIELYIQELKNIGCTLKMQDGQLYCNLDRGTFLEYEDYISEIMREMMLVYIGYNECQYGAVNDLEVEYLVTFVQMQNLEDIILDEDLNPDYHYGLLELQYNFLRMLMYEIPAQYPRFEAYLSGENSLPDEIATFYATISQEYIDKMFTKIPFMYLYHMIENDYKHTEFTLTLLNTFKNNTEEEKKYIISVYDDLLKENIKKQKALSE
jgi:hypothetical protein